LCNTLLLVLGLDFDEDNGTLSEKRGMGFLVEGHHLRGGPKVKQFVGPAHETNVSPKSISNCHTKNLCNQHDKQNKLPSLIDS